MTPNERTILNIARKPVKATEDLIALEVWKWQQLPSFYKKVKAHQEKLKQKIQNIRLKGGENK